jgi:hypothetical protein
MCMQVSQSARSIPTISMVYRHILKNCASGICAHDSREYHTHPSAAKVTIVEDAQDMCA